MDFGAGVTTGGYAWLHVSSITGTAVDADIDVESSADGVTFVSEGTITLSDVGALCADVGGRGEPVYPVELRRPGWRLGDSVHGCCESRLTGGLLWVSRVQETFL